MKFELLFTGKTTDTSVAAEVRKYTDKINHYVPCEVTIINAAKNGALAQVQTDEAKRLLQCFDKRDFIILLDEKGQSLSSTEFAQKIQDVMNRSFTCIKFVIGGAYGLHPSLNQHAHFVLSLSKMTFTHQMVRIILAEQVYRAMTILKGESYHH